jgi:recombination protein RecA
MHTNGISREGDLIDLALEDKIITKSGSHHSYGDLKLGNGRENAKAYLRENPSLMDEIEKKVLEKRGLVGGAPSGKPEENGEAEEPATPTRGRRQAAAAGE